LLYLIPAKAIPYSENANKTQNRIIKMKDRSLDITIDVYLSHAQQTISSLFFRGTYKHYLTKENVWRESSVIFSRNYINKAALCPRSEDVAHINEDM
jgi:hypothetical protein